MLRTEKLTKKFDGFVAVDNVDFEIHSGETQSIIGPNGAGKTTFFNLLSGGYKPTSGSVYLDDEKISGLDPKDIAERGVARSFQISNLFDGLTVLENIRLGVQADEMDTWNPGFFFSKVADDESLNRKARNIAEKVDLLDDIDKEVNELAHGKKRNLEVGVALSTNPNVLLFDEPAAGLTTQETRELLDIIESISGNRIVLLIEHDIDFVMDISDKITVLHQGGVLASGSVDEIKNDEKVQEVYLGVDND